MPIAMANPIAPAPIIITRLHVLIFIFDVANSMKEPAAKITAPSINNRSLSVRIIVYQPCLPKKVTHTLAATMSRMSMIDMTKTIFRIAVGNLKRFVRTGFVECMGSSTKGEKMFFKNFTLLSQNGNQIVICQRCLQALLSGLFASSATFVPRLGRLVFGHICLARALFQG